MIFKKKNRYPFIIASLFSIIIHAQEATPYFKKIDSVVTASSAIQFNGVVLVSQGGKIKYIKAHGYKDFEKKVWDLATMSELSGKKGWIILG
ncbi:MAG: hypothetical protein MUW56_01215 [Chryseobacterium sp.]|uniref:hypothetical protein n=1 Tax=Chryseobacterium sp. TaxID=1871047 RepID=UPI0025C69EA1|nr:hypothetical protein [Chryseobacterium sp.]MCJ7932272.1 hypothetical protein [Chryseobacterium sp.]